jgi:hypothetical protein
MGKEMFVPGNRRQYPLTTAALTMTPPTLPFEQFHTHHLPCFLSPPTDAVFSKARPVVYSIHYSDTTS